MKTNGFHLHKSGVPTDLLKFDKGTEMKTKCQNIFKQCIHIQIKDKIKKLDMLP